ncbi:hypothetical protein H4R33_004298 [Dimargaris cristalligena]|uniref:DUF7707 domain-containing protein n=1 Tax=Dimargaris cristalligena TaxID=215637 RepID=A0A4P9ZQV2_9FUNG|nr:hypothetical protein H4R33_004298 [Dimargaris cristalligena]RKP35876.1 hypothetical protein BJ085DRAFT_33664 [Dimargaris cristalligena]|eukprot:RKP35876.1 hypothetical protein BJ085DRAFT_33664 [Dimargaris cristalligena]
MTQHLALMLAATAFLASAHANSPIQASGWNITNLPVGERVALCAMQIQVCQTTCGGPDLAPKAFCNDTTMGWGCGCKGHSPEYDVYNLPIPGRDCEGFAKDCVDRCKFNVDCVEKCRSDWPCHTPEAPESYLEVNRSNEMPAYKFVDKSEKGRKAEADGEAKSSAGQGPTAASLFQTLLIAAPATLLVATMFV